MACSVDFLGVVNFLASRSARTAGAHLDTVSPSMAFDIWQVKEIGLVLLLRDCAGLFLGRGQTQADLRSGGIKPSLTEELLSSQMTGTNWKENDLRRTFGIPCGLGDFLT